MMASSSHCLLMLASPFPMDCDAALVRETWLAASPEERQALCRLEGDGELLLLKVEEALLKSELGKAHDSAAKRRAALADAARKHGLDQVEWTMQRPRSARMSLKFCTGPLSCDLIIAWAHRDFEEFMQSSFTRGCERVGAARTWEALRKDLFTFMFLQTVERCRKRRNGDLELLLRVVETLDAPAATSTSSAAALRLWPSRKTLAAMRATWAALKPSERAEACCIHGSDRWLVRACEMMAGSCMTKACLKSGVLRKGALESAEYARLRLDDLVGAGCQEKQTAIRLSADFTNWPGALEHILKHAAKSPADKETLASVAALASEAYVSVAQTDLPASHQVGWAHVARLAFTLTLAAFEGYLEARQTMEAAALEAKETEVARALQKAAARKNAKQKKVAAARAAKAKARTRAEVKKTLTEIGWTCDASKDVHVIRTFIDVDDYDVADAAKQLRRCASAHF